MPFIKNISSQGDLELPLVGRVIAADEVIEVSDEVADQLSEQPDVWKLVTKRGK